MTDNVSNYLLTNCIIRQTLGRLNKNNQTEKPKFVVLPPGKIVRYKSLASHKLRFTINLEQCRNETLEPFRSITGFSYLPMSNLSVRNGKH